MCWAREKIDGRKAASLRREICHVIRAHAHPSTDIAAAELIVGEILSNVVRHASGPMCVDLDWEADEPRIVVHDSGPGIERAFSDRPNDEAETGRGLNLISALARTFSAARGTFGETVVTATLPVARAQSTGSPIARCATRYDRGCPFPVRSKSSKEDVHTG